MVTRLKFCMTSVSAWPISLASASTSASNSVFATIDRVRVIISCATSTTAPSSQRSARRAL